MCRSPPGVAFQAQSARLTGSEQRLVAIAAKVSIGGENFVVTAGMREDSNGRLFYDHELMEIESAGRLSSKPGLTQGENTAPPAHLNDITRRFIVQAGSGVSKVVDANGEPRRGWHNCLPGGLGVQRSQPLPQPRRASEAGHIPV